MLSKVKAFTLIELLVVVLIIGILAAVAVPQYQKAVIKSRYATIKNLAQSISQAEELYHLAHGKYSMDFDELDIDMPAGTIEHLWEEGTEEEIEGYKKSYRWYPWGNCHLDIEGGQTVCAHNMNADKSIMMQYQIYGAYSNYPGRRNCLVYGTTDTSGSYAKICESETKNSSPSVATSWVVYKYL